MKKQILLISLMVFSIQSLIAQDAEVAQPSWWQQKQEQAYGTGQKGWEKTKEGIAWIKANPKKAAALGLGAAVMIGTGVYGVKRRMRKLTEAQYEQTLPEWVKKGRAERERLRQDWVVTNPMFLAALNSSLDWLKDYLSSNKVLIALYHFERSDENLTKFLEAARGIRGAEYTDTFAGAFKAAEFEGYSPFSAVTISTNKTPEQKRELIGELLTIGVQPTQKDCMLSKLEFWERTESIKQQALANLGPEWTQRPYEVTLQTDVYTMRGLPPEILREIVSFVPEEEPLIPREYCEFSPGGEQKE